MNKGDIVLLPFPFSDLSGNKFRPSLVLIVTDLDVTVCFITTQLKWQNEFDILLQPSELNGIKRSSVIRLNKLATVDRELVIGRIGVLDHEYYNLLNMRLIKLFKLEE